MLIYGYVRQSTLEQVRWGYNLEEQQRMINEYCEYNYKDIDYELIMYIDSGKSGTNMKRPQLQKLLSDSKKRKPDIVIFHNIDRLSRELTDLWEMIKYFNSNEIQMVSVIGYIDLSTAYGKGNVLNEGLSAMIESMKISDRTIRALKQGVYEGKYPFSRCPIGYKKVDSKLYLTDNENEIEMIRFIFKSIANNKPILSLVRDCRKKYSIKISEKVIRKLIKNRLYTGTMEYRGVIKENYCDPIVTEEMYINANKNIKIRKRRKNRTKYFFKNKVYCVKCNSFMSSKAGTSKYGMLYGYYYCPKCKKVVSQVKLIEYGKKDLNALTKLLVDDLNGVTDLKNELDNCVKQQAALVSKQKEQEIDIDTFYDLYSFYTNKIDDLKNQLKNIDDNSNSYDTLNDDNKYELCYRYIKRINVTFKSNDIFVSIEKNDDNI